MYSYLQVMSKEYYGHLNREHVRVFRFDMTCSSTYNYEYIGIYIYIVTSELISKKKIGTHFDLKLI